MANIFQMGLKPPIRRDEGEVGGSAMIELVFQISAVELPGFP